MGRKIPARKHHGVRDPIKQQEQRLALIKDKINNPPERKDYQKISNGLARFIKLKEATKNGTLAPTFSHVEDVPENYKKKNPNHRTSKQFPQIPKRTDETPEQYLRRVNRITRQTIQEAEFETKYGVEVVRNPETGEITMKKRPRDELVEQMKEARRNRKKKKGMFDEEPVEISETITKKMVKDLMKKKKDEQLKEKPIEENKRDVFRFGEVVLAPPTLSTPRKAQKADTVPRPGKKPLLLNSLLNGSTSKSKESSNESTTVNNKKDVVSIGKIDLKGKRKALPDVTRQMIEKEQTDVVQLYRNLKKSNREMMLIQNSIRK